MDLGLKSELISRLSIFKGLSASELQIIASCLREKTIPAHTTFIKQEDTSDVAYILVEGSAKVYRITEDGNEVNLTMVGKGDIVGEMSLIDDEPRSAYVETVHDSQVLYITKTDFKTILANHPEIAFRLLKTLAHKVRAANEQIEDVLFRTLKERTWKILENLGHYFTNREITFSQEELAGILGATRARVTEALNLLEKEGKITLSHRKIRLN